jgi:WS/DGAT/MGAT family acyltransferase
MPPADAAWLHMDRPNNLMVVNAVLMLDGDVERPAVEQLLADRLVDRYPRFRQRPVEAGFPIRRPQWEDDPTFDLSHHLHSVRLPAPGDETALQSYVGREMARPLDRLQPLWECHLVEGFAEGSAIFARMHHCIADGIALARVLLSLTDDGSDAGIAPPAADTARSPLPALAQRGLGLAIHPSRLVDIARMAPATLAAISKDLFTPPDARTLFRGRTGTAKRAVWSKPFPLAGIKQIARALDATVNDVVLAAVSGALRRYLVRCDSPVHDIRTLVPFNLRPLDQPLPRDLGNHFGLIYLGLPLAVADPVERVAEVHRRMEHIKGSMEPVVSYGVLEATGMTAPRLERLVVDFFTSKASALMTNVPGPQQQVTFAGVPVRRVIGWVPRSGDIGLGISIFSYNGEVTIGFAVDAGMVPDPHSVIHALEDELALLETASSVSPDQSHG